MELVLSACCQPIKREAIILDFPLIEYILLCLLGGNTQSTWDPYVCSQLLIWLLIQSPVWMGKAVISGTF